jgi:hypothetical protein
VPIINIVPHGRASNIFGVVVFGSIDNNTAIFYSTETKGTVKPL